MPEPFEGCGWLTWGSKNGTIGAFFRSRQAFISSAATGYPSNL